MLNWLLKLFGLDKPPDYTHVRCPRCGYGTHGYYEHSTSYDEIADMLMLTCGRCGARWDMPPMKKKEAKGV